MLNKHSTPLSYILCKLNHTPTNIVQLYVTELKSNLKHIYNFFFTIKAKQIFDCDFFFFLINNFYVCVFLNLVLIFSVNI